MPDEPTADGSEEEEAVETRRVRGGSSPPCGCVGAGGDGSCGEDPPIVRWMSNQRRDAMRCNASAI